MVISFCIDCGRAVLPRDLKRGRCLEHYRAYEREKSRARRAKHGTTTQRGYGRRHRDLRKAFERQVKTGLVKCARCGEPIAPGSDWDLGHDDNDRRRYSGPEHRYCNRSTAGKRLDRMLFSRRW
jgi:hypothetical protein